MPLVDDRGAPPTMPRWRRWYTVFAVVISAAIMAGAASEGRWLTVAAFGVHLVGTIGIYLAQRRRLDQHGRAPA